MVDYDKPDTPSDTPPAINPAVDPKRVAEMERDGESEGEPLPSDPQDSEIAAERPGGTGENSRRAMRSAPLLPPD